MGKSVVDWNWRCAFTPEPEPILGPRDWSPKVEAAVRDLRLKESLLPQYMRLTEEEIEATPPMIQDAIKARTAFVAKVGNTHEIVFVCPKGIILMSQQMQDILEVIRLSKEAGV